VSTSIAEDLMRPMTDPILIDDLTFAYDTHDVLDGLSLRVPAGSITALLGGNGAGKSTTLSALLGFTRARSGTIRVCGTDPANNPDAVRRRIAYLPENVALYEHLTAIENADYLLALSGQRQAHDAITAALAAAGLQPAFPRGCVRRSLSPLRCCGGYRCCCWTSRHRGWTRARPLISPSFFYKCENEAPPY
jgi:ABC-type multidrug transport system fused ATPase/permease subunit